MSFVDTSAGDGPRLRTWAAAFALVFALHGLVVAVFLARPISDAGVEAPPAPIMIELPPIASATPSMPSVAMQAQPEPVETDEKAEPADTTKAETVETREATETAPPVTPETAPTDTPPEMPAQTAPTEVRPEAPPSAVATEIPETAPEAPPTVVPETPPEVAETRPEAVVADSPPEAIVPNTPDPEALVAAEPAPPPPPVKPAAEPPPSPAAEPQRRPDPTRPTRTAERAPLKPGPSAAKRAAPSAAPASTPSATASAGGKPDPSELGRYLSQVRAVLDGRKNIPPGAESARGKAIVRFTIHRSGRLLTASLAQSSGNTVLDQTALAMVRRGGFPAAPEALPRATFTVSFPFWVSNPR